MRTLAVSLLLVGSALLVYSKRVVVVPMPNVSHTRYMVNIARSLADLGHEAWVCMPQTVADENVFNTTGIHIIRYFTSDVDTVKEYMKYVRDSYWRGEAPNVSRLIDVLFAHVTRMMNDKKLEQDILDAKPDLMVISDIPNMHMIAVLAYKHNIPFAFAGSLYDPIPYRVPVTTATFPSTLFPYTDRMNFYQRLVSFGIHSLTVVIECFSYTDAVARFAPDRPYLPLRELVSRAEIVLVESEPILDYPKVSLPNVKLIGGTAVSHAKPLKEPFKSFVEEAETDVVVVSFGSYVVNLPEPIAAKLSAALQRLQLRVIWRVNMTSPDPNTILTSTWVPQNDLLAHPKVKLLVSHCGQSSQYEALYHGVPTLCMPIFLDQPYNAMRANVKGFGLTLDLSTSTEDEILSYIKEIYTNSTYTTNVQKASKLFRTIYGLPVEKAAFWLDHVLQHGGEHMRSAAQRMPGYMFYCVDILAFCLVVAILVSLCTFILLKTLTCWFIRLNVPACLLNELKKLACWFDRLTCFNSFHCFWAFLQLRNIRIKAKFS